jgi:membrane-bound lytic murein transglycosylase D
MKIYQILLFTLLLPTLAFSNLRDEFPSYNYIFTEFDVPENFIDNPEFKRFVNNHKYDYRKRFIKAVKQGGLVIPMMKNIIYERDISPIFLYIAMVESEFNTKARSRTGAGGLWQIVVNTGKELKLTINSDLDERYDPVRSTNAAIKYLYRINRNLKSWYLTTMAYNCGNGCVNKAIKRAGTRELEVLISSRNSYIKEETKKYIQKVLLMAMIGENYLFKQNDRVGEMMYTLHSDGITPVHVRSGESLSTVASLLDMNQRYLNKINPHLKLGRTPYNRAYRINIPSSKVEEFNKYYAGISGQRNEYLSANVY